jgi:hypothetical protein
MNAKYFVLSAGIIVVYIQECTQEIKTLNWEKTVQPRKKDWMKFINRYDISFASLIKMQIKNTRYVTWSGSLRK